MTESAQPTNQLIDTWANDLRGPVALHLRQKLVPVEGEHGVLFPPTYASQDKVSPPYCIDQLSDGTKVVQIDSVGSQANRMELIFKDSGPSRPPNPLAQLVPQVSIVLDQERRLSILEAGHRLGDAIVRSSELKEAARSAFLEYLNNGDATAIAKLAPTSLVFGAWDSRDTHAKLPRIVQSVVRAWDVEVLTRSAQYEPAVDYVSLGVLSDSDREAAEKNASGDLAKRGFVHVPAVGTHGGVIARGGIYRDVTINLIALRHLNGPKGEALRAYVLGLALVAAVEPTEAFFRQGCLLTPDPAVSARWTLVDRLGRRDSVALDPESALDYARSVARLFGVGEDREVRFLKERAAADLKESKKSDAKGDSSKPKKPRN